MSQLDIVISSPKQRIPPSAYSPFTIVLSENVFRQGMVVLLNLVYVLLSGMLYVYKSCCIDTCAASSLSGSLLYNLMRASIERLVYKACFGSVLIKNCTDFTLTHVLGRNFK